MPKEQTKFTQTEFADLCKVTKQAIGKAIKAKPPLLVLDSRRRIDINHPNNKTYLENPESRIRNSQAQTKTTNPLPDSIPGGENLDALKRKTERQRGIKLEIENLRKRNELIPREDVQKVFSELYTIHSTAFLNMGRSLTPLIMAICEVTAPGKEVEISEAVTTSVYQHLARIKDETNKFLKEYPLEEKT